MNESVTNFDSDQWKAIGLAMTALTTLFGTGLTIWGGIITKNNEAKAIAARQNIRATENYRKISEIYQDALFSVSASISAMTFLLETGTREAELFKKINQDVNRALERGELLSGQEPDPSRPTQP